MGKDDLHIEIVTPEEILLSAAVEAVEVPGVNGRFTLLRDHAPIISVLGKGSIRVKHLDGKESEFECTAGYLECADNKASILVN